ncbi:MAG: phosphoribosylglycinamide formyltransferase [Gammaproteobacteria bacterium]
MSAPATARCGVVVLVSGRGSNLQAIIDATRAGTLPIDLRAVISNEPTAEALGRARAAGIPTHVIDHHAYPTRAAFDDALRATIDRYAPDLVVLAGFMRLLGAGFIDHYAGRLLNIHPSLLPAFPGLRTHARALAAGAATHGATVHFVTRETDAGPIVIQASVPVRRGDTPETLAARVLKEEHRIYPLAIRWFAEGRLRLAGSQVLLDGAVRAEQGLETTPRRPE